MLSLVGGGGGACFASSRRAFPTSVFAVSGQGFGVVPFASYFLEVHGDKLFPDLCSSRLFLPQSTTLKPSSSASGGTSGPDLVGLR